jgi:large subunit ribosomal protein L18
MSNTTTIAKLNRLRQRRARVRARVSGTAARPRLSVRVTQSHVVAQLVDDASGRTLAYVTTVGASTKGTMTERAAWVGTEIATKAKAKKIKQAVFDRGGRLYHGRLHALAEAARKAGLEF